MSDRARSDAGTRGHGDPERTQSPRPRVPASPRLQPTAPIETLIRDLLSQHGRLTFAEFMELALYHPDFGYYSTQEVLGARGDYVTSPELHPAFGALLGRQAEDCWRALGQPSQFVLREVGAGSGALCRDLLRYARAAMPDFAASLRYQILERSPGLRLRQQAVLAEAGLADAPVEWLLDLPQPGVLSPAPPLPPSPAPGAPAPALVMSNELLDSFPVHLVIVRGGKLLELYVAIEGGRLVFQEDEPSTPEIQRYFERLHLLPGEGCRAEVNLRAVEWMGQMAGWLERGMALTLDYGHLAPHLYAPQRKHGTLLCYYRHTLGSDPLERVGRQDITTHVDFTSLARAGEAHGLVTLALVSQARLLRNLGLPWLLDRAAGLPEPERKTNRSALLQLGDPEGLGRIGALVQTRGMDDYVPLGLRPDAPPPSHLPILASGTASGSNPEEASMRREFERMWRAFVTGDEQLLDDR